MDGMVGMAGKGGMGGTGGKEMMMHQRMFRCHSSSNNNSHKMPIRCSSSSTSATARARPWMRASKFLVRRVRLANSLVLICSVALLGTACVCLCLCSCLCLSLSMCWSNPKNLRSRGFSCLQQTGATFPDQHAAVADFVDGCNKSWCQLGDGKSAGVELGLIHLAISGDVAS